MVKVQLKAQDRSLTGVLLATSLVDNSIPSMLVM